MMEFDAIYSLVAGNVMAAVFLLLWKLEKDARMKAEKRERAVLRDVAGLPDDDIANGE